MVSAILKILSWLVAWLPDRVQRHRDAALTYIREAERRRGEKGSARLDLLKLVAVFAAALLLAAALSGCASLPPTLEALQSENAQLRARLEACEAGEGRCLDLLQECESLLK